VAGVFDLVLLLLLLFLTGGVLDDETLLDVDTLVLVAAVFDLVFLLLLLLLLFLIGRVWDDDTLLDVDTLVVEAVFDLLLLLLFLIGSVLDDETLLDVATLVVVAAVFDLASLLFLIGRVLDDGTLLPVTGLSNRAGEERRLANVVVVVGGVGVGGLVWLVVDDDLVAFPHVELASKLMDEPLADPIERRWVALVCVGGGFL